MVITPDIQHEGESGAGHMPQSGVTPEAERLGEPDGSRKWKQLVENPEDMDIEQPRRTRGLCPDYHYLSNPFGYEGKEEETNILEETYAVILEMNLTV